MKKKGAIVLMLLLAAFAVYANGANENGDGTFTPNRDVTWTVTSSPGGGSDIFTQEIKNIMIEQGITDANLVIDYVTDGGGEIGRLNVSRTQAGPRADHTLLTFNSGDLMPMCLNTDRRLQDFTPIALMAIDNHLLLCGQNSPYDDWQKIVDALDAGKRIVIGGSKGDDIETYKELLTREPDAIPPVYIIGSEVPIPGGAVGSEDAGVQVTKVEDFKNTVAAFEKAFKDAGLGADVWDRVIAVVVQPGVEEKDSGCTEYDREKAKELMASIKDFPNLVFEGHSTDYQTKIKLRELIEDGVGILKVGPGLTFAMREGMFALEHIEKELLYGTDVELSNFADTLEAEMLKDDKYWRKHYQGNELELRMKRKYSFSDRCRYYMPTPAVEAAADRLISNLRTHGVPLNLLSQFMPIQYTKVREGELSDDPVELLEDRIVNTIDEYLYATHQRELL